MDGYVSEKVAFLRKKTGENIFYLNEEVVKMDQILCNSGSVTRKQPENERKTFLKSMFLKMGFESQGAPAVYKVPKEFHTHYIQAFEMTQMIPLFFAAFSIPLFTKIKKKKTTIYEMCTPEI